MPERGQDLCLGIRDGIADFPLQILGIRSSGISALFEGIEEGTGEVGFQLVVALAPRIKLPDQSGRIVIGNSTAKIDFAQRLGIHCGGVFVDLMVDAGQSKIPKGSEQSEFHGVFWPFGGRVPDKQAEAAIRCWRCWGHMERAIAIKPDCRSFARVACGNIAD